MKRSFLKAVVAIAVLTIAASTLDSCQKPETPVYTDPAQTIEVRVGDEFIITLEYNSTTGHEWKEAHDRTFIRRIYSEFNQGANPEAALMSYRYRALKAGTTQIDFVLQQPWETEPLTTVAFKVQVR